MPWRGVQTGEMNAFIGLREQRPAPTINETAASTLYTGKTTLALSEQRLLFEKKGFCHGPTTKSMSF